jgi:two-component system NtrC family response regulator
VRDGHFREDLFYRLNVIPIHIPPLRERQDDIPALWEHFVRLYAGGVKICSTPDLMRALMRRRWPGNVRELANVCQRMVLLRTSDTLDVNDLPHSRPDGDEPAASEGTHTFPGVLPEDQLPLWELERGIIVRSLEKHQGNQTRTAEYLGIPRHILLYRMEKYGID